MKKSFYIKISRILCAVVCFSVLFSALSLGIAAQALREYTVTVDGPVSMTASNMPAVLREVKHGNDPELIVSGWIKTDQTIRAYEYTMDGGKTWTRTTKAVHSRPDTKAYNPKTYETAGFKLQIDVSELPRGKYDLFVRAYTDKNDVIDVLAMIDVSIGQVDKITMTYRQLNLRAFGAEGGVLKIAAGQELALDTYNLREFQSFEVHLDQNAVLTLKSEQTSAISFSRMLEVVKNEEDDGYVATVSLTDVQYAGKLILHSAQDVKISRIRFYTNVPDYYQGELTIRMTATPYEYLSGANAVDAVIMSDQTVGMYMRLYPLSESGDPYIYFNLGKYLKETRNEILINADHYGYMVMTLQMPKEASAGDFRLFLCAGEIHGPHGDSHVSFQPIKDGQWHKYVIPLCSEDLWTGSVYGMRFDFIDGQVNTSDYANIASMEFYRDEESAKKAAAKPYEVYYEEGNALENPYKEEGRAPSGKADAITYFDQSLANCFSSANQTAYEFDDYGHLILQATKTFNDPFLSFDMKKYSEITGLPLLRTEDYGIIVLRVYADKKIDGKGFTLYYYSGGLDYAKGDRSVTAMYSGGKWEYLVYQMADRNAWTDQILGVRLDYAQQINTGQRVCLSDILFFKDMDAWNAYAEENGIEIPGNEPVETESQTPAPETEVPTIEIPTQGPGLEYIPPEQNENVSSCQSMLGVPVGMVLSLAAVMLINFKNNKKGDKS